MKYILKNVNLLDGTKNMKVKKTSILVEDGKIIKISNNINDDVKVYDLDGKYAIPGLINLHAHLPIGGKVSKKKKDLKKLVHFITSHKCLNFIGVMMNKKTVKEELYSGVTTVRAVGGLSTYDTIIRNKINKGKVIGPRLIVANGAITVKDGHMEGTVSVAANTINEVKALVRQRVKEGVDFIKIMITGGVLDAKVKGEPGDLKMKPSLVNACCIEAHAHNLKVVAHVEGLEGCKVALENGVDFIEHGTDFDEECIQLFKKTGSSLTCTISPAMPELCPEAAEYNSEVGVYNTYYLLVKMVSGVKKAIANDIPIGLGTDAGCPLTEHYNFYREMEWYSRLVNRDRKEALYLGTLGNAKLLNLDKEIGSIEVDKCADIVILDNNPLDTFVNCKNPYMVIHNGKIINQPKIKRNPLTERCLDPLMNITMDDVMEFGKTLK